MFVWATAVAAVWQGRPVAELLEGLRRAGIRVLYSSDLVTQTLTISEEPHATTIIGQATEVLAPHGLMLEEVGPRQYIVVRRPEPVGDVSAVKPLVKPAAIPRASGVVLHEITVYSSHYAFDSHVNTPLSLSQGEIEAVPGTRNDALRAAHALPGIATGASSRPYIRGSQQNDILLRFDGVAIAEPFHLKAFQSLISAFDPSIVDRMEVYSGGYPVRFGTRSGGVIDLEPRTVGAGRENEVGLSLLAANAASVGQSSSGDFEWLIAARRSVIDLVLDRLKNEFGNPRFVDLAARLRWQTSAQTAWTVGALWLDDRIQLRNDSSEEIADSRSRDLQAWLTFESKADVWRSRTSLALTRTETSRNGTVARPQVVSGSLFESRELNGFLLSTGWHYGRPDRLNWNLGAEVGRTGGEQRYTRAATYTQPIAQAFGIDVNNNLSVAFDPHQTRFAAFAAVRPSLARNLEIELGLRVDGQDNGEGRSDTQWSPRINVRYQVSPAIDVYGSLGKFTQAQRPEELRLEEGQRQPDPAQVATHTILGLSLHPADKTQWRIELYRKRWAHASPYFDNLLDPLTLLPDIDPDRVRIAPQAAESQGAEISVRRAIGTNLDLWGSYSWAKVADEMIAGDVARSWDQRSAIRAGFTWVRGHGQLSGVLTSHSGWPRTSAATPLAIQANGLAVLVGPRNSARWGAFYSLDLRSEWTKALRASELQFSAELTNASNHANECCTGIEAEGALAAAPTVRTDVAYWLPRAVNVGVTWRFH